MTKFAPSAEQVVIGEAVAASLKDWKNIRGVAIDAGAGCGKTTALMYLMTDIIPRKYSVVAVVFNRKNKQELSEKIKAEGLTKARAQTFNGLGFGAFMKHYDIKDVASMVNVDNNKYHKIARYLVEKHIHGRTPEQINEAVGMLASLWDYLRHNTSRHNKTGDLLLFLGGKLSDPESTTPHGLLDKPTLRKFTKRYHQFLEVEEDEDTVLELLPVMAKIGYQAMTEPKQFKEEYKSVPLLTKHIDERRWIDLTDQTYYCVVEQWKVWGYTIVLIDEAQDASPLDRALADMHRWKQGDRMVGRVVLVGDPEQAIYMFRGADGNGFYNSMYYWFVEKALPLSVSYRCPKLIAELARNHKKEFTSFEGNIDGEIATVNEDDLLEMAQDGDACISRVRSVAVSWWRRFLAAGKPAILIGNGMGDNVLKNLDMVAGLEGFRYGKVFDYIERYKELKLFKLEQRERPDEEVQRFIDEINTAKYFVEIVEDRHPETNSLDACKEWIEWELNPDNQPNSGVQIMTGHVCKGLEFDRVFDITPDKFPMNWKDQTPEEFAQEMNLDYVKNTRAKKALFTVSSKAASYLKRDTPPEPPTPEQAPEPEPEQPEEPSHEPSYQEVYESTYCTKPEAPTPGTLEYFAWRREVAKKWAAAMTEKDWVVLDFETTGIGGEPVQIGIIDKTGEVLLSTLVKPGIHKIEPAAKAIHKISDTMVENAPTFKEVFEKYKEALDGKTVVAYNVAFEKATNDHTCKIYDLVSPTFVEWEDPMLRFAEFFGRWSAYRHDFTWQKLTHACQYFNIEVDGAAHDAVVDVEMTRQLIYAMAGKTAPPAPERETEEVEAPKEDIKKTAPNEETTENKAPIVPPAPETKPEPEQVKVEKPVFTPAPAGKNIPKPALKKSPIENHLVKIFEQLPNDEIDLLIKALENIRTERSKATAEVSA